MQRIIEQVVESYRQLGIAYTRSVNQSVTIVLLEDSHYYQDLNS